ncbi:MAG: HlyD family type I secretion periplasmic adaptor subunit [Limnohabitans sp.]|nr:MAG: HlyD family type I secretion periplasmic adaptor subunit [Limnohabitans sp.]
MHGDTLPLPGLPAAPAVDLDDARARRWGWLLLLACFGSFTLWATMAPLDSAVVSPGTVTVTGSRKVVQPLTAGKVAELRVREGDAVVAGQPLVRLDDTASRAQLDIVRGQWLVALATQARLEAELQGSDAIAFPEHLAELGSEARVKEVMDLQSRLLTARRQMRQNELRGFDASLQGLEYQVQGREAAREAKEAQSRLMRDELRNQKSLADEGYYPRNRLSEQERSFAELLGSLADDHSQVGRARQNMAEVRARRSTREQELRKDVETQLSDAQREASALEVRMRALEFELANTTIVAPTDGIVMAMNLNTVGGVVSAGAVMMELVPTKEPLRVEVMLPAQQIDRVKAGMDVDLQFTAFNTANTPRVEGKVVQVSPDALVDPRHNGSYFKLAVEVPAQAHAKLRQHEIRAGMPVEVFIKTGERTFMNYVLKPLQDRLQKALIEP